MSLTAEEVETIAAKAATQAVTETLLKLGVNAGDPDDYIEMQKDFAHVRAWRQSVETVRNRGLVVATGIIVSGIIGAIWLAIKGH